MSAPLPEGSFPASGPFVYTAESEAEARRALGGATPAERRWFHATRREAALSAVHRGLIPSCWRGGDCCAVCGHDSLRDVHLHQGPWVLEIKSHALAGQLKSWWVPAEAIEGAWHKGTFFSAAELRAHRDVPAIGEAVEPCRCPLRDIVGEQIEIWSSLLRSPA